MNTKRLSYRYNFSNAPLPGQGIVAAPEAYFAKQSMERVRRGTAKSPVYKLTALGRQLINGSIIYKNIKLSGTQGVTTEGKQIATQDDKVMGFDTHIMVIPSGPSTTTAPLPHPFIGKITDEISDNVKIKDKGVATKGSKAKHDDSMHMQLPGTIQFQNSPKCEGEVTGGTGSKVKVNGKEVAVIGSQITTCNDMGYFKTMVTKHCSEWKDKKYDEKDISFISNKNTKIGKKDKKEIIKTLNYYNEYYNKYNWLNKKLKDILGNEKFYFYHPLYFIEQISKN